MNHQHDPALEQYPHGRGYGHDYLRGGEVFGGYGYSTRDEYETPRGEILSHPEQSARPEQESPPPQQS